MKVFAQTTEEITTLKTITIPQQKQNHILFFRFVIPDFEKERKTERERERERESERESDNISNSEVAKWAFLRSAIRFTFLLKLHFTDTLTPQTSLTFAPPPPTPTP